MLRRILAIACTFGVVLAAAAAEAAPSLTGGDRVLVIPFDNPRHEAKLYWLTEASAILLADELNAAGHRAYTREERLEVFEQLQVPPVASLSHAMVIRLGQLIGATHVVIGSLTLDGSDISVRARTIKLDTGRFVGDVAETGPLDDLFGIFGRLGAGLGPIGGSAVPAAAPAEKAPSPQVFENYVKGLLAAATPSKVSYLQAALKLDSSFHRARLALWAVNQDNGSWQAALVAASAVPDSSPLYARARFSVALSLIQLDRLDDAFATLKALGDRLPSATVMNNLGVIQMRRPSSPPAGRPSYYFNEAVKLDPDDSDSYFNLGYAYWVAHDAQGAIFWLREAVRRDPADADAHAVLAAALQAVGSAPEAARERELAAQLSSAYAEWAARPGAAESVLRGLERLKPALEVSALKHVDMAIATGGQRDQRELAAFHLGRGQRFFEQGSDAEAIAELRRALYLSPYEAEAHLLLGQIYLRAGQTQSAIDAFKIALWSDESAAAHLALAQAYQQARNDPDALTHARRALELSPNSAEAAALLDKLKP